MLQRKDWIKRLFFTRTVHLPDEGYFLVPHAEIIYQANLAKNNGKSCGYVAATLLADYWTKILGKPVYPSTLHKPLTPSAIHNLLLGETKNASSWAYSIWKRWRQAGFMSKIAWRIGWFLTYHELHHGRPVILFGGIPDPSAKDKYINHAILAYGYKIENGQRVLLTHYGWENYPAVLIRSPLQGSAVFFKPTLQ